MQLTQCQLKAIDAVRDFLHSPDQVMLVKGYAGTGKTEVIKSTLKLLDVYNALEKATGGTPLKLNIAATTIKAKELLTATLGKAVLTFQSHAISKTIHYNKLIIIDEYSYISDTDFKKFLMLLAENVKVILVGDPLQLEPPQGKPPEYLNVKHQVLLEEVVRQNSADSSLAKYIESLRNSITTLSGAKPIPFNDVDLIHLTKEEFIEKASYIDTVAFTNLDVVTLDQEIHQHTYGNLDVDQLVRLHPENIEVRVRKITNRKNHQLLKTSAGDFEFPNSLKERAEQVRLNTPYIQLGHVMTVHKAQGSTYTNICIDLDSIKKCPDALVKLRLLYVAMSRAKHKVYFTGEL